MIDYSKSFIEYNDCFQIKNNNTEIVKCST